MEGFPAFPSPPFAFFFFIIIFISIYALSSTLRCTILIREDLSLTYIDDPRKWCWLYPAIADLSPYFISYP